MKKAIVTMMNDGFYIAYVSFIKSLLTTNRWILEEEIPIVVIDDNISPEVKNDMFNFYPFLDFRKPQYGSYANVNMAKTPEVLRSTYYKLDTFSYDDFDRIVFLDLDINLLGDVHELFEEEHDFAACKGYSLASDALRGDINSGVFVVNKPYLNMETYRGLLGVAQQGFSMPDQKTINIYFSRRIFHLPKKYNCEKRMARSKTYSDVWDEKCIVHWISEKPWQPKKQKINMGFEETEKIWWNFYNIELTSE